MHVYWANWEKHPETNQRLCDFVSTRIWGKPKELPLSNCMAVSDDTGRVVGVMVYHNYQPDDGVIEISGAADTPRWLTRKTLREMFEYPFGQLGCQAVVMRVDPDNAKLSRMLTALGFERTTIRRLRGRNKDECLFVLYDDVWRNNGFSEVHHGQKNA